MTSRRKAIEKIVKSSAALGFGGVFWGLGIDEASDVEFALRPPGALIDDEFEKACVKCGQCAEACPYDSIKLADPGEGNLAGTPYITPRDKPCYMCQDIPCTKACPSGALDLNELVADNNITNINETEIGLAVIHKESCLAFWGIQCDACYRACPLIDKAITITREINQTTQKHANLIPVINSDHCTGCGICEHTCIVEKAAVMVLPKDRVTGQVGNHYIKSWDKNDEKRIDENKKLNNNPDNNKSTLDYLNDDEELFD